MQARVQRAVFFENVFQPAILRLILPPTADLFVITLAIYLVANVIRMAPRVATVPAG